MLGMSSVAATFSIAARESQEPFCICARHNSASTADACRPGGYLASSLSAHALFSSVNSKLAGCLSARRRTDIGQMVLDRAENGADVGQHVLAAEEIHRLEMREARRPELHAIRLVGAIGHEIDPEL